MCNGEVSSSIRKNRDKLPPIPSPYDDNFVEQLTEYIPTLQEAKFYGGEPFMVPLYYKIWEKIRELNPKLELFVITNGTLWNKNIESLINDLNFDVAISIDALDKNKLEKIRKNVVKETLLENINRFSEICRRKNKYLSLSFTIQKENWDQLPAHIELCNSVEAYAYISYLENPKEFSILELPREQIEQIRKWMDEFSFPTNTAKEKHNKRCFDDYKTYLDAYLNNEKESRYNDYQFVPEWADANDAEIFEKENHIRIKPNATKEEFLINCDNFMMLNPDFYKYDLEEIKRKLNAVLNHFDQSEHTRIFGMILKADMANTLKSISENDIPNLVKSTEEMLPLVVIDAE
jgi:MoaA/NifB/PqqE/SkfB family radical SAM enzyme